LFVSFFYCFGGLSLKAVTNSLEALSKKIAQQTIRGEARIAVVRQASRKSIAFRHEYFLVPEDILRAFVVQKNQKPVQ